MQNGRGQLAEVYYETDRATGRVACPGTLVPSPGQYLLAAPQSLWGAEVVTALPLFTAGSASDGFLTASAIPEGWGAGMPLYLRGPLGHGFSLPASAKRVGFVAWEESPARLLALLPAALAQEAEVTLVCRTAPAGLAEEVEIQPLDALEEICRWADFLAMDIERDSLHALRQRMGRLQGKDVQVLVRTPVPCGAMAECGVCAVRMRRGWKMACKDGPVFDWRDLGD
ncbi:MAG: hypothetical protein ACM3QS_15235 [Bacteroidota bacterium]